MSLDDKLREILMTVANDYANSVNAELDGTLYRGPDLETAYTQIKQAFADEGYTQFEWSDDTKRAVNLMVEKNIMIGQEWYDRFYNEVMKLDSSLWTDKDVFKAAKRASGLE